MKSKILLFARDPGGANTVIPLHHPLVSQGYHVLLYGKDTALDKYRNAGLSFADIRERLGDTLIPDWLDFLGEEKPDLIITGTSAEDPSEKHLWEAARSQGIPSAAILDQWENYGIRFSPYPVSKSHLYEKDPSHPYLPDHILVMDNVAAQAFSDLGIGKR